MASHGLHGKRVLVVGGGVTGSSVARYLKREAVVFDLVEARDDAVDAASLPSTSHLHHALTDELLQLYDVLLLSPGVPRAQPVIRRALERGVAVIGDVELYARADHPPVIAVTGSNGKSTVVSWIGHVLEQAGVSHTVCGNIGRPVLDCLGDGASLHVIELSSFQLESTERLESLSAAVLNVSDDHLDRYDSIAHYAATKRRIHRNTRHSIVNLDDVRTRPVGSEPVATHVIGFSLDSADADYRALYSDGVTHLGRRDGIRVDAHRLSVPGRHSQANALAVLALIEPLQLDDDTVTAGLVGFRGLAHRTEFVGEIAGVRWYNDSKGTNVDACIKAIDAMPGPVWLIAGGQGKGADFRALRESVSRAVECLLLIGEDRERIADALDGAARIERLESLEEAVRTAAAGARSGDVVLLSPACASFDMFRNFEDRGDRFRQAVERLAA